MAPGPKLGSLSCHEQSESQELAQNFGNGFYKNSHVTSQPINQSVNVSMCVCACVFVFIYISTQNSRTESF